MKGLKFEAKSLHRRFVNSFSLRSFHFIFPLARGPAKRNSRKSSHSLPLLISLDIFLQTGDKESQELPSPRRRADGKLPETSEAIKNAVIEQAVNGKKRSCLCRFFCGKSVNPTEGESSETENKLLLEISHKKKSVVNGKGTLRDSLLTIEAYL